MKLIIAGGRDIETVAGLIFHTIDHFKLFPTEIVSGGARGVDKEGEWYAAQQKKPVRRFIADWNTHNRAAGPIRNKAMAEYGDVLLLIWNGESRGSASMKEEMEKLGKPIYEVILKRT